MNKASGSGGIPAELFQVLKDDAVKVLHSICQQIWKTQQWFYIGNHFYNGFIMEKVNFHSSSKSPPLLGVMCSRACIVPCF